MSTCSSVYFHESNNFSFSLQRLAACVKNAMENVWFAIPTCARVPWCESAMNATMEAFKDDVWFAAERVFQTLTTAKNVRYKKRTETAARRSSTSDPAKQTCSTNAKSMDLSSDNLLIPCKLSNNKRSFLHTFSYQNSKQTIFLLNSKMRWILFHGIFRA